MILCFMGDIHGRIFHAIAVLIQWQRVHKKRIDFIAQVGDFGAYPTPDEEMLADKFVQQDPSELDFSRFYSGNHSVDMEFVKTHLRSPIHFIRGNHEDFRWLAEISKESGSIVDVDPWGLVRYIKDGTELTLGGMKLFFLGGIETEGKDERSINQEIYEALLTRIPGDIDILVTHEAPYGISTNFKGRVQGSKQITRIIETIKPKFLISGHYHHMSGPTEYGATTYRGLNILIPPVGRDPLGKVQPGSMVIMDTETGVCEFVMEEWLNSIHRASELMDLLAGIG